MDPGGGPEGALLVVCGQHHVVPEAGARPRLWILVAALRVLSSL